MITTINEFRQIREAHSPKVQSILDEVTTRLNAILDTVEVSIVHYENDYGKTVPHIQAVYPGHGKNDTNVEEINKYFSTDLFIMGIDQRKDWINASDEEKQRAHDEDIHPARYIKESLNENSSNKFVVIQCIRDDWDEPSVSILNATDEDNAFYLFEKEQGYDEGELDDGIEKGEISIIIKPV